MIIYGVKYEEKVIYVGQTIRPLERRVSSYRAAVKSSKVKTYIINHLRCHGFESHEFFVIESDISSKEELNEKEILYITSYNTLYPNGMNLTEGGDSPIFSKETRKKMSNAKKGNAPWNKGTKGKMGLHWAVGRKLNPHSEESKRKRKRFGEQNHFFGKTHTKETLEKLSKALKGRKVWNKINDKVMKLDKNHTIICTYVNKDEAVKDGFDLHSLTRAIRKHTIYKGFYFRIANESE